MTKKKEQREFFIAATESDLANVDGDWPPELYLFPTEAAASRECAEWVRDGVGEAVYVLKAVVIKKAPALIEPPSLNWEAV